jgi:uncharacterized repeat protein (TIGR01451 family)
MPQEAAAATPSVKITKSCPNLRYLGREAKFEITVENTGDAAAHDVIVSEIVPEGLDFRAADNNGAREGNRIVWRVGTLEAGQSRVLNTTFLCNRPGRFKNLATVTYCAEATAECELAVEGVPAILLECVDDPDPIEIDANVNYTITVTNQGTAVGTNISIVCTLPAELEYVDARGPTNSTVDGNKITFAPVASIAPKANVVYKVTAKGVGQGDVRFHVELKSDQIGEPVMETEATRVYE